jgi:phosphate transport system permease protein
MTAPASTATKAGPPRAPRRPADKIFSGSTIVAGGLILAILAAVAAFLVVQSIPALIADPDDISLSGFPDSFWQYVGPLAFGTVYAAALALVIALPIAIGIALFISHYAPRRLAAGLGYVIDLLAAVPSVVFGLWGGIVLAPAVQPVYAWMTDNLRCSPVPCRAPVARCSPPPSCSP